MNNRNSHRNYPSSSGSVDAIICDTKVFLRKKPETSVDSILGSYLGFPSETLASFAVVFCFKTFAVMSVFLIFPRNVAVTMGGVDSIILIELDVVGI